MNNLLSTTLIVLLPLFSAWIYWSSGESDLDDNYTTKLKPYGRTFNFVYVGSGLGGRFGCRVTTNSEGFFHENPFIYRPVSKTHFVPWSDLSRPEPVALMPGAVRFTLRCSNLDRLVISKKVIYGEPGAAHLAAAMRAKGM